jgi:hypothetical protein
MGSYELAEQPSSFRVLHIIAYNRINWSIVTGSTRGMLPLEGDANDPLP